MAEFGDIKTMDDLGNFLAGTTTTAKPDGTPASSVPNTASPIGPDQAVTPRPTSNVPVVVPQATTVPAITAAQSVDPAVVAAQQKSPTVIGPAQTAQTPPSSNEVTDLFTVGGKLSGQLSQEEQANQVTQAAQAKALAVQQGLVSDREAAAATLAKSKGATADNLLAASDKFSSDIAPVDQTRKAIADRQQEIITGNPFMMFFRGIIDRNYNPEYLAKKSLANELEGQAIGQTYKDQVTSNVQKMQAAQDAYVGLKNMWDTKQTDADETSRLTGALAIGAHNAVTTTVGGIAAQQELNVAEAQKQSKTLGAMTLDEVNKNLALSQSQGGKVTVNGAELTTGQLQQEQINWKERNLSLRSHTNAVAAGDMEVANMHEKNFYDHSSLETLQQIQASGKLPNGQPVNQAILGQAIQDAQATATNAAAMIRNQGMAPLYTNQVYSTAALNTRSMGAANSVLGGASPQRQALDNQLSVELQTQAAANRKAFAISPAAGQASLADGAARLQKYNDAILKLNHDESVKFGAGDKDMTDMTEAYMNGVQLNPLSATRGMIKFAMTGHDLPGTTTPEDRAMQAGIRQIVNDYYAGKGPGAGPMTQTQRAGEKNSGTVSQELVSLVGNYVAKQHAGLQLNSLSNAAPTIARGIPGADGKPHPASQIPTDALSQAHQIGSDQANKWAQSTLGVPPMQLADIIAKGESSVYWKPFSASHGSMVIDGVSKPTTFNNFIDAYQSHEAQGTIMGLRTGAAARPGYDPGKAYVDLMNDPEYQKRAMQMTSQAPGTSVASYATNAVAGSRVSGGIIDYGTRMKQALYALDVGSQKAKLAQINQFKELNPTDAARFTMYTNRNVHGHEADAFTQYIMPQAQALATKMNIPINDAIDTVITKTKLPDPDMEKTRKILAEDWMDRRQDVDRGVGALVANLVKNTVTGAFSSGASGQPVGSMEEGIFGPDAKNSITTPTGGR